MALNAEQKALLKQAFKSTLAMPENKDLLIEQFPNLPTIPYPPKSRRSKKQENQGKTTPVLKPEPKGLMGRFMAWLLA